MEFSWSFLAVLLLFRVGEVCHAGPQIFCTEGQSVILPCNYTRPEPPLVLPKAVVIWKDPEDQILLKFNGTVVVKSQPGVKSFEGGPAVGNFSIRITNVKLKHTGNYECHIPSVGFQRRINLTVTVNTAGNEKTEEQSESPGGAAAQPELSVALVVLGTFLHMQAAL